MTGTSLFVVPAGLAPAITPGGADTVDEDSMRNYVSEPDDDDYGLQITQPPGSGTLEYFDDIDNDSQADGGFIYTANYGYAGPDQFSYKAVDVISPEPAESLEVTVYIEVLPVVEVTGYNVERREWGGTWITGAAGGLLWKADEHRWTATYTPATVSINSVSWQYKDWDLRDIPEYPWYTFANAGPENQAIGNPPPGDWAIRPLVTFTGPWPGGELVVQMTPPRRQPLVEIIQTEWVGVTQGDGLSNLDGDPILGGYRIFAERNHPQGTTDASGNLIDQVHDKVKVRVTINPAMPAGYSGTVNVKVFDPDYYGVGGPANTPDDGDPNEHDASTYLPNDNFGGLGMSPAVAPLVFNSGALQKSTVFTIDEPQAGNNFIMGVHHSSAVLNRYTFMPDGKNLYVMDQGQQELIFPPYRSDNWLTVRRTLWMELDDMVAPDPAASPIGDGPFDGAGVGNDDVQLDPPLPPIGLAQSSMQWALIDVKPLPAQYDQNDGADFRHNMPAGQSSEVSNPVRDEQSERPYWVVHTIGAYEEAIGNDWDPNGEANSWLGWAYQIGTDKSNFIFFETIRDRQANDPPPNPPNPADLGTLQQRVVFHEALHRFFGDHGGAGSTGVQDGIMVPDTALYGSAQANELTPRQMRKVNEKDYPR